MGCVASKLEEEEEVVTICRERKRLLKLAVEKRYALAEAHCKYFHSLNAVAAAIKLFVARHSSPSSPFLITFPPPCPSPPTENVITNPMFLQQKPSETKHEAIACDSCISSTTSESSEEEGEEKREREDEVKREKNNHVSTIACLCLCLCLYLCHLRCHPLRKILDGTFSTLLTV
ncbi:serine carboxypeptidase 2 [Spatholobus suberectus]|nr:serine carboxypeptidase 2 [Spatholobus suberectus]